MKFCKDCKWIEPPGRAYAKCTHPTSVLPGEVSLVTGQKGADKQISCEMARTDWGSMKTTDCGPDGQYWEPAVIGFGEP